MGFYLFVLLSVNGYYICPRTVACGREHELEHADRNMPPEWCDQKGVGHDNGSMQTGAIYFEKKNDIRFFSI